ncbi:MAG: PD40 domain-containing protein [Ignavibacteriae bacterium]|nr:PD40 domain-containing protein [Ignavibacteriota bacterium]
MKTRALFLVGIILYVLLISLSGCNKCDNPIDTGGTPTDGESQMFFNYSLNINSVQIFTCLSDGTNQHQWNTTNGFITSNIWSGITSAPRAGKIAFTAGEYKENAQLVIANTDGSNAKVLVPSTAPPDGQIFFPVLAPDADKVAFMRASNKSNIYMINSDGTGESLIATKSFAESYPTFSPDGKKIAYYTANKTIAVGEIQYANGQYSVLWEEPIDSAAIFSDGDSRLDWSPDSKEIVYVRGIKGISTEIWIYNTELHSKRKISSGICAMPAWSPDGSQIAYSKVTTTYSPSLSDIDIMTIRPDGKEEKNITDTPDAIEQYPQWSADSKKIVINSFSLNYGKSNNISGNIVVIDIATLTPKLIATNAILGFFTR